MLTYFSIIVTGLQDEKKEREKETLCIYYF